MTQEKRRLLKYPWLPLLGLQGDLGSIAPNTRDSQHFLPWFIVPALNALKLLHQADRCIAGFRERELLCSYISTTLSEGGINPAYGRYIFEVLH